METTLNLKSKEMLDCNVINVFDITHYGNRINTIEIDICTHQFEYEFENNYYLITKHNGEIVSVYRISKN